VEEVIVEGEVMMDQHQEKTIAGNGLRGMTEEEGTVVTCHLDKLMVCVTIFCFNTSEIGNRYETIV